MSVQRRLQQLIASFQDIKLGHATASYAIKNGVMEIYSVRVPQRYRRQGQAKAIMQHLIKIAEQKIIPIKLLASPLDKRTNTNKLVRFYQQFGFKLTGKTGNLMGDPWMERPTPTEPGW
jgi:GNAT superfamily N-acetyltransferase